MTDRFEQWPKESAKAYAAFSVYLGMGEERSLAAVGQKLGKSVGLIERWSRKFEWGNRVQAHAAHLVAVERQAKEVLARSKAAEWLTRQEKLREEEWSIHEECIRAGREALKRFHERGKGATLGDIARMLELASKIGRLATGMATDRTELTGEDGGPIRIEFEMMLQKVYGPVLDVESVPQPPLAEKNDAA
jgi:hypothetical protein